VPCLLGGNEEPQALGSRVTLGSYLTLARTRGGDEDEAWVAIGRKPRAR